MKNMMHKAIITLISLAAILSANKDLKDIREGNTLPPTFEGKKNTLANSLPPTFEGKTNALANSLPPTFEGKTNALANSLPPTFEGKTNALANSLPPTFEGRFIVQHKSFNKAMLNDKQYQRMS